MMMTGPTGISRMGTDWENIAPCTLPDENAFAHSDQVYTH